MHRVIQLYIFLNNINYFHLEGAIIFTKLAVDQHKLAGVHCTKQLFFLNNIRLTMPLVLYRLHL